MKKKQEKKFAYDSQNDSFVFTLIEQQPIIMDGKEVASHNGSVKQIWTNLGFISYAENIRKQIDTAEKALKETESKIKSIGVVTNSEKDKIAKFKQLMKRSNDLDQLANLEKQRDSQKNMLNQMKKDIKEIEEVINVSKNN